MSPSPCLEIEISCRVIRRAPAICCFLYASSSPMWRRTRLGSLRWVASHAGDTTSGTAAGSPPAWAIAAIEAIAAEARTRMRVAFMDAPVPPDSRRTAVHALGMQRTGSWWRPTGSTCGRPESRARGDRAATGATRRDRSARHAEQTLELGAPRAAELDLRAVREHQRAIAT